MQRALIVYDPQSAPKDHESARRGFAEFLRRGGRARPVPFDGEAVPQQADLETAKPSNPEVAKILRTQTRLTCATNFAIVVALLFAVVTFISLSISIMAMRSTVDSLTARVMPHADHLVNAAVQTMQDAGGSMMNMRKITKMTSELAEKDLGPEGAASRAINSTALIAERFAQFMSHPTIQLSLGGV
jgi:hypothetical protein